MSTVQIELPPKLIPVFAAPNMFIRGAYGGRGSGKTRNFAKMACVRVAMWDAEGREGIVLCVREFMNSLDDSSFAEIKAAISGDPWLSSIFEVGSTYIRTKSRRIEFIFVGLSKNLDSIKSKARILLCWADEADPITDTAWIKLIPTIREEGSELWVCWNPELEDSATDKRFRKSSAPDMIVVEINWRDNPWFPSTLERTRKDDEANRPEQYNWIWEGGYLTAHEGAYFAALLEDAKRKKRICRLSQDPLMTLRSYHDIGGAGAKADAYSIWIAQFVDREVRVLDHYTSQGQTLAYHVQWMRQSGYGNAEIILPHDGVNANNVSGKQYKDHWEEAGFKSVRVIPNQGTGAAKMRIEAARRLFPRIWFDEDLTAAGRKALGWYHEKIDDKRKIGLGPNHDWSSHCFTGETEVLTRYGTCQIMNLPEAGEVLTPWGWKPYRNPRVTRKAAPLVEVTFAGGYSVKCTGDHLFLTESGWKSALSLQKGSLIRSSLTPSRNTSTAASTVCGRVKDTCREAASAFTEMFGRQSLAPFLPAATSTTGTTMFSTTGSRTWSASRQASTSRFQRKTRSAAPKHSLMKRELLQLLGINPKRDGSGTAAMPSGQRAGPNGSASLASAIIAARRMMLSSATMLTRKSIAPQPAKRLRTDCAAKETNTPLRIARVRRLNEQADVWCMSVPGAECFSLANGAVVHNCSDAFGLMCVDYREPTSSVARVEIPSFGAV